MTRGSNNLFVANHSSKEMVFIKMFGAISKSTNRLVGLGLFNIFTMAVITYLSNKLESTTGVSAPPPDLWFGYDSKEIYEWINQIGVEGTKTIPIHYCMGSFPIYGSICNISRIFTNE